MKGRLRGRLQTYTHTHTHKHTHTHTHTHIHTYMCAYTRTHTHKHTHIHTHYDCCYATDRCHATIVLEQVKQNREERAHAGPDSQQLQADGEVRIGEKAGKRVARRAGGGKSVHTREARREHCLCPAPGLLGGMVYTDIH
jgi:CRISPR/Cas system CSM-associated protein Csm3 (group 7 of RAMP superfamily)